MVRRVLTLILSLAVMAPAMAGDEDFDIAFDTLRFSPDTGQPLEVLVRVKAGEVIIEPASGDEGDASLEWDKNEYRARMEFDENRNRLNIDVDGKGWMNMNDDDHHPILRLRLPTTAVIRMDARIKAGEIDLSLGGLSLEELSLNTWAGELDVDFDRPNPVIMKMMDIRLHVGEATLQNLGNARFERADINSGIGELSVDFSGDLIEDGRVRLDLDIGETDISVPIEAGVRFKLSGMHFMSSKNIDPDFYRRGSWYYTDGFEDAPRKLSMIVSSGLGELNIDRR